MSIFGEMARVCYFREGLGLLFYYSVKQNNKYYEIGNYAAFKIDVLSLYFISWTFFAIFSNCFLLLFRRQKRECNNLDPVLVYS